VDYFQVRLDRHDDGYQGRPVFGKSNLIYMLVKHESDLLRPLLALMCSPRFRTQVAVLAATTP